MGGVQRQIRRRGRSLLVQSGPVTKNSVQKNMAKRARFVFMQDRFTKRLSIEYQKMGYNAECESPDCFSRRILMRTFRILRWLHS